MRNLSMLSTILVKGMQEQQSLINAINLDSAGDVELNEQTNEVKVQGNVLTQIAAFAEATIGKLKVGVLTAKKAVIDGIDIVQTLKTQQQEIDQLKKEVEALKNAQSH